MCFWYDRLGFFQIAKEEEKGVYLNFLNFLINDSIYLLDESLNKILELKELEAEMSNTTEWERRPAQERQERTRLFHSQENVCLIHIPNNIYFCFWILDTERSMLLDDFYRLFE